MSHLLIDHVVACRADTPWQPPPFALACRDHRIGWRRISIAVAAFIGLLVATPAFCAWQWPGPLIRIDFSAGVGQSCFQASCRPALSDPFVGEIDLFPAELGGDGIHNVSWDLSLPSQYMWSYFDRYPFATVKVFQGQPVELVIDYGAHSVYAEWIASETFQAAGGIWNYNYRGGPSGETLAGTYTFKYLASIPELDRLALLASGLAAVLWRRRGLLRKEPFSPFVVASE